jgi:segregation and condensation protein B
MSDQKFDNNIPGEFSQHDTREDEETIQACNEDSNAVPPNEDFLSAECNASDGGGESSSSELLEEPTLDETPATLSSRTDTKAALEALLFATTEPLSVSRLARILEGVPISEIRSLLLELQGEYDARPGGLQIAEVAGGFQMATRPQYAPWLYKMKPSKRRAPLSQATLETLAIIAYKQPITRAEIEAIRGVDSSATLHTLLELGLVEVGGKREVPGRPQVYVTTQFFLKSFGLKSLGDLPSVQELRKMFADTSARFNSQTAPNSASTAASQERDSDPPLPLDSPKSSSLSTQGPNPESEKGFIPGQNGVGNSPSSRQEDSKTDEGETPQDSTPS